MSKCDLVLASQSPRRLEIVGMMGLAVSGPFVFPLDRAVPAYIRARRALVKATTYLRIHYPLFMAAPALGTPTAWSNGRAIFALL